MTASTTYSISQENLERYTRIDDVPLVAYLVKALDGDCQVVVYDKGYEYSIRCDNYVVLLAILNGMKGIEK
jgi:hypothetical protein